MEDINKDLKTTFSNASVHDWGIEEYLAKIKAQIHDLPEATLIIKDEDVTLERLNNCYTAIAKIVVTHGEVYFPIFERLHREIQEFETRKKLLKLAFEASTNETL